MMRRSFLPRLQEHDRAAELLSRAADALVVGELEAAARHVRAADLKPLADYAYRLGGPIDPAIHRQHRSPVYTPVPRESRPRMPGAALTREIFARDGYRCRYCGTPVVLREARKVFVALIPEAARWGRRNAELHCAFNALHGSIDHVLPFKRGGDNDPDNLVTACGPCQFGRNDWLLEEVEIEDPRKYPPVVDGWDGLLRVIGLTVR